MEGKGRVKWLVDMRKRQVGKEQGRKEGEEEIEALDQERGCEARKKGKTEDQGQMCVGAEGLCTNVEHDK